MIHNRYTRTGTCVRWGIADTYNRYKFVWLGWLDTDDRRSAQPLAPREQLRFTYFLLWGWSA
jgi:hypothetical protein